MKKGLSLFLVLAMLAALTACGSPAPTEPSTTAAPQSTASPVTEEYTEPEGCNQVTFYWAYLGSYESCDMWI